MLTFCQRKHNIIVKVPLSVGGGDKNNEVISMINQDWIIVDVLSKYPEAEKVFKEYGIRCFG